MSIDKSQFNAANIVLHFISMVLAIIASLAIMIGFVLDARYEKSGRFNEISKILTERMNEVDSKILTESTERKIVEAQVRRDILNAKEDSIELKKDLSEIRMKVFETNENVAILLERTGGKL